MRSLLLIFAPALFAADPAAEFKSSVRPVLEQNCGACHNAANPKSKVDFLKAQTADDIQSRRSLWRSVAAQLRNRTMPPAASKLSEDDRMRIANWVDSRLKQTACAAPPYAGAVAPRRLNRREYHNTIRDLLGVDLPVSEMFPADESGGAGFDTNGETLYVPPMMLERYLESAQKALDRAIITPPMNKVFSSWELSPTTPPPAPNARPGRPLKPNDQLSVEFPVFLDGQYNLRVSVERPRETPFQISVQVDGVTLGKLDYGRDRNGGPTARIQLANLDRGVHKVTVVMGAEPVHFYSLTVEHRPPDASPDKRTLHFQLLGLDPGDAPINPRAHARRVLSNFLPKAFRRPVPASEIDKFLALYDRAAHRGDPFEESLKLALKAVLVSPAFLFKVEDRTNEPTIRPLSHYDIASRLSYFLWSTAPDAELTQLAAASRLQDPAILRAQVDRLLDDPRSRAFTASFMGQWLGTQDIGGRAVPLLTELQHFYTPEVAADLRQEPALLLQYILAENRPVTELLTADYTFLTARLARYYQVDDKIPNLNDTFQRVTWPDNRRAGVLGFASILAMSSHYKQSSPVLRGAWVLDTLLGTPVPAPPPDVPPLAKDAKSSAGLTMRQMLARHRQDPACFTCHNLMDPIGFALENFDWMGRWRDTDNNGGPVDASGQFPSGEKFTGPVQLRNALLARQDDFLNHITSKLLGFALGRALQDGDSCTIQNITSHIKQHNLSARELIHQIALSLPFRNTQGGISPSETSGPLQKRSTRKLLGEK